jgi:hypothetical protein
MRTREGHRSEPLLKQTKAAEKGAYKQHPRRINPRHEHDRSGSRREDKLASWYLPSSAMTVPLANHPIECQNQADADNALPLDSAP